MATDVDLSQCHPAQLAGSREWVRLKASGDP
jgi:hypothetical protein